MTTDRTSHPQEYEVTDENRFVPVASPALLLVEVLEKLTSLEEEYRNFREEVALERAHDRKRIADLEDLVEREGLLSAQARQRISKLEAPAPALKEVTAKDHIDRLFVAMRSQGIRQTTTKGAARLLGVSKPLIDKIKPYLAADSRFVILRDPNHKQRHIIRLAGT